MNVFFIIKLLSFLVHIALGLYVFGKNPIRRLNQVFLLAALSIAIMDIGYAMLPLKFQGRLWMQIAVIGQCLTSGNTILLTLIYGRTEYRDSLKKAKFYLIPIYILSLAFMVIALSGTMKIVFLETLPDGSDVSSLGGLKNILAFNKIGILLIGFLFICTLIALVNLENTYRNTERIRKRIRYPVIVLIGALSFQLLIYSLALGFSYIRIEILAVASITFMAASICMAYPVIRPEPVSSRIYVGREVIAKSYTLLLAGAYLLIIGMLGKIIQIIGTNVNFFLAFLAAFFILLISIAVLLSRSLKRRMGEFIQRNFYRHKYDYRKEWENFSRRVSSILSMEKLLQEISDTVSEAVGADRATVMVLNESRGEFSTFALQDGAGSDAAGKDTLPVISAQDDFLGWLWRYGEPVIVDNGQCRASKTFVEPPDVPAALLEIMQSFMRDTASDVDQSVSGICVPIIAQQRLTAIMVLGRSHGTKYSQEDLGLLETMANQISIAIINARTSQELVLSRELESLYRLSGMLLHDLKSSASMLSLVIQNAANNFSNPEFQKDALGAMSNVVNRIQNLILRLSAASQGKRVMPNPQPADLSAIASQAVTRSGVRELARIEVMEELSPVSQLMVDLEDIERVILNLILNAIESIDGEGKIYIETCQTSDGYAQISISDTGCGMSQGFINEKLFRPFQTTKERGLGVGLYQCKAIVDACGGSIEAQSHQGAGSRFTVRLPVQSIDQSYRNGRIANSAPREEVKR